LTWGEVPPRFSEAVGDLEHVAPLPALDEVLALAGTSPAARLAEAEVGRSLAAVELAESSRVPDLGFGLGMRWDEIERRDYLFDLEIDLPVFDRKRGAIQEARAELARAQAAQRSASAANSVAIAELHHLLVEADRRRATIAGEILPAARAAFEAFRTGFANESETLEDLLDARQELAEAEADYAEALVARHAAQAALAAAVGPDPAPGGGAEPDR
jgi:cobalt-zinc-cadmium efflux system outer membrane protein